MENKTSKKLAIHSVHIQTAELSFSNNCASVLEVDSKNYEDFVSLSVSGTPPRTLAVCLP